MVEARSAHFLRAWRRHRGISLEAAAEAIGMSHPNLSKIERGLHFYTQDQLDDLAALYNCTVAELLFQDPAEPSNILHIWASATANERRAINAVAENIISYRGADEQPLKPPAARRK